MLNISQNNISKKIEQPVFSSFQQTALSSAHRMFKRWLLGTLAFILVLMFLPWTQNIQSKGKITTLRPEHRPQTIPTAIAGRIEKWYVQEGETVKKGDTIVHISEIKTEYFDPDLVPRTNLQVKAKEGAIESYRQKVDALEAQIANLKNELVVKQEQLINKIRQAELELASDSIEVLAARIAAETARDQLVRTEKMFQDELKSLNEVQDKRVDIQKKNAELIAKENKLLTSRQKLEIARLDLANIRNEYNQKIAKAESDKFSTLSEQYDAESSVNKLRIESANYAQRSQFYFITAPQDCYITKALKPGVGETVKEGDPIVSIMPRDYQLAVELYIKPMDLPLISLGQEVRFIFDGWPAFIFSGWPGQSFGTYSGQVVAIDNNISDNGAYRILVGPEPGGKEWPVELRPGSGAQGIALLNNVFVWYEIWRKLNGFPPDYYDEANMEEPKLKAPAKSIK